MQTNHGKLTRALPRTAGPPQPRWPLHSLHVPLARFVPAGPYPDAPDRCQATQGPHKLRLPPLTTGCPRSLTLTLHVCPGQ